MQLIHTALVLPLHDPEGRILNHLDRILPELKKHFEHAFVSLSPLTTERQQAALQYFQQDGFFTFLDNPPGSSIGDHYLAGYRIALEHCQPETRLHLCDLDKLCFILQSEHHQVYLQDLAWVGRQDLPVLFQRSPAAWETFPANYREIEQFIVHVGEMLFQRYIDFAWSYMVMDAATLADLQPHITSDGFSLLTKILLQLDGKFMTKDVDWLSWEDPFILDRDADELRRERETSLEECEKRLSYTLPNLQLLYEALRLKIQSPK